MPTLPSRDERIIPPKVQIKQTALTKVTFSLKKILAKIGCDICSEISYYMMNEGYDLEQITEIMYSKYKHDVRITDIEEEKDYAMCCMKQRYH